MILQAAYGPDSSADAYTCCLVLPESCLSWCGILVQLSAAMCTYLTCCCRGSEDKHGEITLSRQTSSLLQLTAAVHHLNAWSASTGAADAGRPDLPHHKKLKVQAASSAPVNAMLKETTGCYRGKC